MGRASLETLPEGFSARKVRFREGTCPQGRQQSLRGPQQSARQCLSFSWMAMHPRRGERKRPPLSSRAPERTEEGDLYPQARWALHLFLIHKCARSAVPCSCDQRNPLQAHRQPCEAAGSPQGTAVPT